MITRADLYLYRETLIAAVDADGREHESTQSGWRLVAEIDGQHHTVADGLAHWNGCGDTGRWSAPGSSDYERAVERANALVAA